MKLEYDLNAGALYIRLSDVEIAHTAEAGDNAAVDLDASGGVVGIEVISVDYPWPADRHSCHAQRPSRGSGGDPIVLLYPPVPGAAGAEDQHRQSRACHGRTVDSHPTAVSTVGTNDLLDCPAGGHSGARMDITVASIHWSP